ncbi:E3 ubiquitin-protein ligase TRIM41 isoform X2 [Motacilla alba alba]|uniref:E3 ubiquitin-protein ligase TRIM41 isoform X2 n=1 Tax=Motacilla alba alba TaxID=1094192 RepID=UPI0018D51FBD|nr:E3 ubiquitin-protein ligase TRIM41 isoform X2 [Motacilla alba alba]
MAAPAALGGPGCRPDPVETLQEEAICAICLDYFAEPVSIGCGHNFCRGCISRLWARAEPGPGGAAGGPELGGDDDEEEEEEDELEEDELDVEQEEEEEEEGGVDEEEDDDMWEEEEEEEEEEEGELWGDPAEDEEEEEEEEGAAWAGGAQGGLYFGAEDYDEEVMEEDVEEEGEEEDEEEEDEDEEEEEAAAARRPAVFTCPQCRKSFAQRSFRPNLQLANMVQIIRQLHPRPQRAPAPPGPGPAPGGPPELCHKHQEPLKLFCEVCEAAICVVCREARGHKHHSVVPLDEVVQDCKNKLQSHLEPLRRQLEALLKQKCSEEEKVSVLRMQAEMRELEADFEVLHRFLAGEQVLLLRQLQERHEALLARQRRNLGALEERGAALRRLISDAEAAGRQDGLQLLKDIKGTFIRCENIKFQEPEMVPVDVGKKFRNCFLQDVVMRKMEKVFSKVPQADVTLDPSTAHPRLSLSLDRRSVRLSERRPEPAGGARRGDGGDLCVLGAPGFSAGRHYWEVEVGGRRGWAVGAARESARPRHKGGTPGTPKREIWAVGTSGKKYQALSGTEQTALAPGEQPRRFGVYLDYERGQLCFYNAESMSHIHTFHICCRERVFPFFRILAKGTRIKICT